MSDTIQKTWDALGNAIEATGYRVFVRTESPPIRSSGGIFFAPEAQRFYAGPMHLRIIKGLVLSVGPKVADLEPGERVCFQRKYYVRCYELKDGVTVGCINLAEVTGVMAPDVDMGHILEMPGGDKQPQHWPM